LKLSAQKNENNLVTLSILFKEEDYYPEYLKKLQEYKKNVNIPGFRKNAVPIEIIKQKFGPSILFQQLSDVCNKALEQHFVDFKYKFLTSPYLYTRNTQESKIPETNDHQFIYKFMVSPESELNLENLFPHYTFEVNYNPEERLNFLQILSQNKGKSEFVRTLFLDNPDLQYEIRGYIPIPQEINNLPKEKLHIILNTLFLPHIREVFKDKSIGHSVKVNVEQIWPGFSRQDLIYLLCSRPQNINYLLNNEFEIVIDAIIRVTPAVIDNNFINSVFSFNESENEEEKEKIIEFKFHKNKENIINYIENEHLKFNLFENNPFTLPKDFLNDIFFTAVSQSKRQITREQYRSEFFKYLLETKFGILVSQAKEKINLEDPDENLLYEFLLNKHKKEVLADKEHPLFGKNDLKYPVKNNDGSETFYTHSEMENEVLPNFVSELVKNESLKENHISSFLKNSFLEYVKNNCVQKEVKPVSLLELYNYSIPSQKFLTYIV
jgi:trigger factor